MGAARAFVLVAGVMAALAGPAAGGPPQDAKTLHAAAPGPLPAAHDGRGEAELVRFDDLFVGALGALEPEETIRVEGWPVAPAVRARAVLRRFDVYAPDARIVAVEDGVTRDVPRARARFFHGTVEEGPDAGSRFAAWLDPDTGAIGGIAMTARGTLELVPPGAGETASRLGFAEPPPGGRALSWGCAVPEHEDDPYWSGLRERRLAARAEPEAPRAGAVAALGTLSRSAVIAFDTDAEYLSLRFANDTANAATYIAQLVAGMSVLYERDVAAAQGDGVKILQGYTILRVGEAGDPYSDTTGSASSAKLDEFGDYWEAHYPPSVVRRSLAALLSGKQGSSSSASGIAWVGALCSGVGYSVDQLFTGAYGVTADLGILAHEVGHNFGAFHTHNCYYGTPPIDRCVAPEGGCTTATGCPGSQTFNGVTTNGTLMSYCHTIGCSPRNLVFHPRSVTDNPADPYGIDSVLTEVANATCLTALSGGVVPAAPTLTGVSPASGPLAGGTTVTLTGTNFAPGATVAFVELASSDVFGTPSSKPAASVAFNASTQLTVTTPSATSAGTVDVVVMNPDRQTATRAGGFVYAVAPPPTVTAVSPVFGPAAGGTSVTITGAGFVATPTVTFGGTSATGVSFVSSSSVTATAPAHAAGLVSVVVTNPDLQAGTLSNGFFYAPAPTAARWFPLTPCRVVDTRLADGPLGGPVLSASQTRAFDVTTTPATCGIPSDAKALTVNYTVTSAQQAGEIRTFAGDAPWTGTSVLSFRAGATRANNGHLLLAGSGTGAFQATNASTGTVHFILDVNGYYR